MANRRLPLLVDTETLHQALDAPGILVVDLSDEEGFEQAHIPGAVHLRYGDLLRQAGPAKGLMADTASLSRALSGIGLRADTHVVACDSEGNGRAGRFLWTLEALGHFEYSLLDGGVRAWRTEGLPTESGPSRAEASTYQARLANPDVIADRDYVQGHLEDDGVVVLDARSPAEYRGEDVRAARGGHIPGAVNLDWTELTDPGAHGRLHGPERLRALLKERGATPDREIVTHCQTHHRSGLSFFALRYLGYPSVRAYPGSWSEWGNDPSLPIRTGDEP